MRLGLSFGAVVCLLAALTCRMILAEPAPGQNVLAYTGSYHPGPHWMHRRMILSRTQTEPATPVNVSAWTRSP